jgi:chromosome segregation ATPase
MRVDFEGAMKGQSVLSDERESVQSKLETEHQQLESLQKAHGELITRQEVLIEEQDELRAKLETERQNAEHLSHDLSTSKANEASIAAQLEERNSAVVTLTAENARLLDRIRQLESNPAPNPPRTFSDKIKRFAKTAVCCSTHRERDLG